MGGFTKHHDPVHINQLFETIRYIAMSEIETLFKTVGYLLSRFTALNTLIVMGVSAKRDEDLMNFYEPLGCVPGGFVAMEDVLGMIVETRADLLASRDSMPNDDSDKVDVKDALLLVNTVASVEEVKQDWEHHFNESSDETQRQRSDGQKTGKPTRMEIWKVEN